MEKISVVINTYNASLYLAEVLSYLTDFDEVVVCDMESTDDTREIAASRGCRIVTFPKGDITICEPARNFAIQSARNEWVLVVDADEIVPAELARYLHEYVNSDTAGDALNIPMVNLSWTGKPGSRHLSYHCRLLKKSKCNWPPTIHSRPEIDGRTDTIKKNRRRLAMLHKSLPVSENLHKRLCTYTDNEVKRRGPRMKGDVSYFSLIAEPLFRFVKSWILQGGIFKGKTGYIEAKTESMYKFITLCKLHATRLDKNDRQTASDA